MTPLLTTLFDSAGGASVPLPSELEARHGGPFTIAADSVYSNFVTSLDGVVALGLPGVSSGASISGRAEGDRFLMGLLRSVADVVLVGAGTLRDDHGHLWTPGYIHPPSTAGFAELRSALGLSPEPRLAVVTASGRVDPTEPAFGNRPIFLTTAAGAARLRALAIPDAEVAELGADSADAPAAIAWLRGRGLRRILTEGGPGVMGWLLRARQLDEAFITLSPVVAGRIASRAASRPGMVEGVELLPDDGRWGRLVSLRRAGDHLFARYDLSAR